MNTIKLPTVFFIMLFLYFLFSCSEDTSNNPKPCETIAGPGNPEIKISYYTPFGKCYTGNELYITGQVSHINSCEFYFVTCYIYVDVEGFRGWVVKPNKDFIKNNTDSDGKWNCRIYIFKDNINDTSASKISTFLFSAKNCPTDDSLKIFGNDTLPVYLYKRSLAFNEITRN